VTRRADGLDLWTWQRLIRSSRLTRNARLIGLVLALRLDFATLEGWPAIATLAADAGSGRTSVKDGLRELRSAGYVVVTYRGRRGHNRSNVFRATCPVYRRLPDRSVEDPAF
jgi:hypothetical protein